MPTEVSPGLWVETVGDILGDAPERPAEPFMPLALDGTPALPPPGIYFDLPDAIYHALPALSQSGIKKLWASPMIFWASCAWLNARYEDKEKIHYVVGRAYHCRLLEGASAFAMRFCLDIEREDYPEAIESTDEIKDYIVKAGHKPVTTAMEPDGRGGERVRKARKEDWTNQLLDIDPDAPLWIRMKERHAAEHAGKQFIWPDLADELAIAAMMIERDPGIAPIVNGGHAEVTLLWHCPKTGVPMKARVDKMKVRRMIDLKTMENSRERSIETTIRFAIGGNKYNIQPSVYLEGGREVRAMVRQHGASAVHVWPDADGHIDPERKAELTAWAMKWAKHMLPDEWTWICITKSPAPIARAVHYPVQGTTKMVTDGIVLDMKRRFLEFSTTYGTEPWLDIAEPYMIADEDLPQSTTDI